MVIDLNCDLGESFGNYSIGNDPYVMKYITSANVACGFHAGDPTVIEKTIILALENGVGIGAHPGYPDLAGFGRRYMQMNMTDLRASILYQVGAVKAMTEALGGKLQHVKPHGALYNAAANDYEMATVITRAVKDIDSKLVFVGLAGSKMLRAAENTGLKIAHEVFADRAYNNDGTLVARSEAGAVIHDVNTCLNRVMQMIHEHTVLSITGETIPIKADTICIHGDNKMALDFARSLHTKLSDSNVLLQPMSKM